MLKSNKNYFDFIVAGFKFFVFDYFFKFFEMLARVMRLVNQCDEHLKRIFAKFAEMFLTRVSSVGIVLLQLLRPLG